jgi:hypothetical protein
VPCPWLRRSSKLITSALAFDTKANVVIKNSFWIVRRNIGFKRAIEIY